MKKIIAIILLVMALLLTSGCNKSYGFGNYSFKKIHIDTHNYSGCFTVEKWYDNSQGIEVKTAEVGAMFFSEGTYVLIEKECPFCKALEEEK